MQTYLTTLKSIQRKDPSTLDLKEAVNENGSGGLIRECWKMYTKSVSNMKYTVHMTVTH